MGKSWTNWQTVDITEVVEIHKSIVKRAGTKAGIRDFSLLHSAVERSNATFQGQALYPTIFLKAAALLQSLCMNHPFTDGNKRTAWMSTKRFLKINGYHLKAERLEAVDFKLSAIQSAPDFMVFVDNSKPKLTQISSWLRKHSKKI